MIRPLLSLPSVPVMKFNSIGRSPARTWIFSPTRFVGGAGNCGEGSVTGGGVTPGAFVLQ